MKPAEGQITGISECPYCEHLHKRLVTRALGSHHGKHHCENCRQEYAEHFRLELTLNTYPIVERHRKPPCT